MIQYRAKTTKVEPKSFPAFGLNFLSLKSHRKRSHEIRQGALSNRADSKVLTKRNLHTSISESPPDLSIPPILKHNETKSPQLIYTLSPKQENTQDNCTCSELFSIFTKQSIGNTKEWFLQHDYKQIASYLSSSPHVTFELLY